MDDKPATADPAANKAADAAAGVDTEWSGTDGADVSAAEPACNRQQVNRWRFLSAGQRAGCSRTEDRRRGKAASRSGGQAAIRRQAGLVCRAEWYAGCMQGVTMAA